MLTEVPGRGQQNRPWLVVTWRGLVEQGELRGSRAWSEKLLWEGGWQVASAGILTPAAGGPPWLRERRGHRAREHRGTGTVWCRDQVRDTGDRQGVQRSDSGYLWKVKGMESDGRWDLVA